ncbi:MAG: hypothetical protein KF866_02025 [Phycisphaeraceae bacterium]|nr:hypothetical protein [Phycisphaeraceae bacterium]
MRRPRYGTIYDGEVVFSGFLVLACLIVTGLWLLAGQAFFVNRWTPSPAASDSFSEIISGVEFKMSVAQKSMALRGWMVDHIAYTPREASRSGFAWGVGLVANPLLNVGLGASIMALLALGAVACFAEMRTGLLVAIVTGIGAFSVNAVCLASAAPKVELAGSWCLIGAYAGVSILGPHMGIGRLLGLVALAMLYFRWPEKMSAAPTELVQWVPALVWGALVGLIAHLAVRNR